MSNFRVMRHVQGLPSYLDSPVESLEEWFSEAHYSFNEAENYLARSGINNDSDQFGRKSIIYLQKI